MHTDTPPSRTHTNTQYHNNIITRIILTKTTSTGGPVQSARPTPMRYSLLPSDVWRAALSADHRSADTDAAKMMGSTSSGQLRCIVLVRFCGWRTSRNVRTFAGPLRLAGATAGSARSIRIVASASFGTGLSVLAVESKCAHDVRCDEPAEQSRSVTLSDDASGIYRWRLLHMAYMRATICDASACSRWMTSRETENNDSRLIIANAGNNLECLLASAIYQLFKHEAYSVHRCPDNKHKYKLGVAYNSKHCICNNLEKYISLFWINHKQ